MVNIIINARSDFPCPVGWTVVEAEERIRSEYGLLNGGIRRNGQPMLSTDTITADGDYQFVHFQDQSGRHLVTNDQDSSFLFKHPSSAGENDILPFVLKGSAAVHQAIFEAQLRMFNAFNEDLTPEEAFGKEIFRLIYPKNVSVGVLKFQLFEESTTAILSSMIQSYFTKHAKTESNLLCTHQYRFPIGKFFEKLDILIMRQVESLVYLPMVTFECANSSNSANKRAQLFEYIWNFNNSFRPFHPITLGVLLEFDKEDRTRHYFILKAFYYVPNEKKLAEIILDKSAITPTSIARLLYTLNNFLSSDLEEFKSIKCNHNLYSTNTIITDLPTSTKMVNKIFDYRSRDYWGLSTLHRGYEYSLQHIPQCQILFRKQNEIGEEIVIIQYPFIEGGHLPAKPKQIIGILQKLHELHSQNILHLDIRASNLIFNDVRSIIIDYDFAQQQLGASVVTYPNNYNRDIRDGKRHPGATPGGVGESSHDCYGLSSVLKLVTPADSDYKRQWKEMINLVKEQKLSEAIAYLRSKENKHFSKVQLIAKNKDFEEFVATGNSPHKMQEKRAETEKTTLVENEQDSKRNKKRKKDNVVKKAAVRWESHDVTGDSDEAEEEAEKAEGGPVTKRVKKEQRSFKTPPRTNIKLNEKFISL